MILTKSVRQSASAAFRSSLRYLAIAGAACIAGIALGAGATDSSVIVVSPEVVGPEAQLFRQLRDGARAALDVANTSSIELSVPEGAVPRSLSDRLAKPTSRSVIVLGRRALQAVEASGFDGPIIVGGVDLPVGEVARNRSAIGLFPAPAKVLGRVNEVLPDARRVIVVASPVRLRELRQAFEVDVRRAGLTLAAHEAASIGEGAAAYLNALRFGNPATDVIWIIENSETFTSEVLPRVIELAWANRFAVISNYVDHVTKGALLAPYPDANALGFSLGRMAVASSVTGRVEFLGDLKFAANLRTARHLVPHVNISRVERADMVIGLR